MDMQSVIEALRKRGANMVSLDEPQDSTAADVAADVAAGFLPGVGTAMAARDFERARRSGDKLGMTLAAAGMIPVAGGAVRATQKAQATASALRGKPVFHGSPRGPIEGPPRVSPHDETGIPGFSVSRSEGLAKQYADDYLGRHTDLVDINPAVTKFELTGRVADYGKFMDRVRKQLPDQATLPTAEQIMEYARKRRVVGLDHSRNLGIDEISVLFPEALRRVP